MSGKFGGSSKFEIRPHHPDLKRRPPPKTVRRQITKPKKFILKLIRRENDRIIKPSKAVKKMSLKMSKTQKKSQFVRLEFKKKGVGYGLPAVRENERAT